MLSTTVDRLTLKHRNLCIWKIWKKNMSSRPANARALTNHILHSLYLLKTWHDIGKFPCSIGNAIFIHGGFSIVILVFRGRKPSTAGKHRQYEKSHGPCQPPKKYKETLPDPLGFGSTSVLIFTLPPIIMEAVTTLLPIRKLIFQPQVFQVRTVSIREGISKDIWIPFFP